MPGSAYQGHADYSASKAVGTDAAEAAPADGPGYDSTAYAAQPGAAARAGGFPRHDARPGSINQGGRVANGSART